jgi:hypothetical protein
MSPVFLEVIFVCGKFAVCGLFELPKYRVSEKDFTLFYFVPFFIYFFLGAQCVESGVSCTDCY